MKRQGQGEGQGDGRGRAENAQADEKGKPEAVNLEREEPITTAARRRDRFVPGEPRTGGEHAPDVDVGEQPGGGEQEHVGRQSETTRTRSGGRNLHQGEG